MEDTTRFPGQPAIDTKSYLLYGENLVTVTYHVLVKTFEFHAILTNRRILLIDRDEQRKGVFAREIEIANLKNSYFEENEKGEPVLVLSIQVFPDETKTMKLSFPGRTGLDDPDIAGWSNLPGSGIPSRRQQPTPIQAEPLQKEPKEVAPIPPPHPVPAESARTLVRKPLIRRGISPETGLRIPPAHSGIVPAERFCSQCGEKLPDKARYCPFCGAQVR